MITLDSGLNGYEAEGLNVRFRRPRPNERRAVTRPQANVNRKQTTERFY
jgi:hypothetical protein